MRSGKAGGWTQQVDATLSNMNPLFKGGVYDPGQTTGMFCGAKERHMEPLEGGAVIALSPFRCVAISMDPTK